MRSGTLATALVCSGLLALAARADAPKNVDGDNLPLADYVGKLTTTLNSDGAFTMKVEFDRAQVNPGAVNAANTELRDVLRDQERIDRIQADIGRTRDPKRLRQLEKELTDAIGWQQIHAARAQANSANDVKIVKDLKDVDFHAAGGVKVRTQNPPVQFDEKGNPKQYTKDELKALKGKDTDLPGYEATPDSLKVGDTVKVTLSAPKPAKKDGDKDKDSDSKNTDAKTGNQVTVILILAEPDSGSPKK
jgi:hypothetical protein